MFSRISTPAARALLIVLYGAASTVERDCSHRCNNGDCVRIAHLVPETHALNLSRSVCKNAAIACPHTLPCIRESAPAALIVIFCFKRFKHRLFAATQSSNEERPQPLKRKARVNDKKNKRQKIDQQETYDNKFW